MKRRTKLTLVLLSAAAVLLLLAVLFAANRRSADRDGAVNLVLGHQAQPPAVLTAIERELLEFGRLNAGISVRLVEFEKADSAAAVVDAAILSAYPDDRSVWETDPLPWSGSLWVLAARKDKLELLAKDNSALVDSLRSGTLEPAGFEALLTTAAKAGIAPITLGNSHGWPYVLLLQMWTAASIDTAAAAVFPLENMAPYPQLQPAIEDLKRWRANGWFHAASWSKGWAEGLQALNKGEALFSIISQQQLGTLTPDTRAVLEYLPFPRNPQQSAWTVGSAHYLVISAASPAKATAGRLLEYLSSPGVTSRLSGSIARPFFSWQTEAGKRPQVLSAWVDRANSRDFDRLLAELADD